VGENLIAATYFCPDHPDQASNRRKPAPGMIVEAANDLDLDLPASFMIGDNASDIEAGLNAGVKAGIWVTESPPTKFAERKDVWVARDFRSAVEMILRYDEGV